MKKIRFLALLTALALVLAGCGEGWREQKITVVHTDPTGGESADVFETAGLPDTPPSAPDDAGTPEDAQTPDESPAPDGAGTPEDARATDGPQNAGETQAPDSAEDRAPEYGGYYYDVKNVVLYLESYGQLPPNYITKNEARDLGWSGGSVEDYLEGAAIGGDRFGNYEGLLPEAEGRTWTECDIDTLGCGSRGSRRLVFSGDGLYYYTSDHYESFKEVTVENGEVSW